MMPFILDPAALPQPYKLPLSSRNADTIERIAREQGYIDPMVAVWADGWFLTAYRNNEYFEFKFPEVAPTTAHHCRTCTCPNNE